MKRKKYSTEQIVVPLKQVELGLPLADLIRQLGVTEQIVDYVVQTHSYS